MSTGIFSKAIQSAVDAQSAKKYEDYVVVNVRPGEKVSAMLDVIAHLSGKSPTEFITEALSAKLAEFAASSLCHADAVLDATETVMAHPGQPHRDSALGILMAKGLIETSNPFKQKIEFAATKG